MTRRVYWGLGVLVILLIGVSAVLLLQRTDIDPKLYDPYNQAAWGPVSASSQSAIELPPFADPSFEKLIEQFKVDVAENRGDPEVLKRKKEVISNPDLLYQDFTVPIIVGRNPKLTLDEHNPSRYKVAVLRPDESVDDLRFIIPYSDIPSEQDIELDFLGEIIFLTQDQVERMSKYDSVTDIEYYKIMFEGIDPLTAGKYFMNTSNQHNTPFDVEFGYRAMRAYPHSVEAMRVWAECHTTDEKVWAYQELLSKFPNAAFAHQRLASLTELDDPAFALIHIQKACQLDSRIAKESTILADCYNSLGEWEKAVAAYQNLFWIGRFSRDSLLGAQDQIHKHHKGYGVYELMPLRKIDSATDVKE